MECGICSEKQESKDVKIIDCCAFVLCEECYLADFQLNGRCPICRRPYGLAPRKPIHKSKPVMEAIEDEDRMDSKNEKIIEYEKLEYNYENLLGQIAVHKKHIEDYNIQMREYQAIVKRTELLKERGYVFRKIYKPEPMLPEFANIRLLSKEETKEVMKRIPDNLWNPSFKHESCRMSELLKMLESYQLLDSDDISRIQDSGVNPEKYIKSYKIEGKEFPFISFEEYYGRFNHSDEEDSDDEDGVRYPRNRENINYEEYFSRGISRSHFTFHCKNSLEENLMKMNHKFKVDYHIFNVDGLKMCIWCLDIAFVLNMETKECDINSGACFEDYVMRINQFSVCFAGGYRDDDISFLLVSLISRKQFHFPLKENDLGFERLGYIKCFLFEKDMIVGTVDRSIHILKFEI